MPLSQAIYDVSTQTYFERPFRFQPVPVLPGPALDADIGIALSCYARAGVLPTGPSLLFMGDAARGLFLRRNESPEDWDAVMAELGRRHPRLLAHDAEVRARVAALATGDRTGAMRIWRPSMPEACVGWGVLELKAEGVTVVGDAALPGGRRATGHVLRCDFCLTSRRGVVRIEVAGLLNRFGPPPTFHGAQYEQIRMPARSEAYTALGLRSPITIYADEALDRSRLLPIIADVVSRLA